MNNIKKTVMLMVVGVLALGAVCVAGAGASDSLSTGENAAMKSNAQGLAGAQDVTSNSVSDVYDPQPGGELKASSDEKPSAQSAASSVVEEPAQAR